MYSQAYFSITIIICLLLAYNSHAQHFDECENKEEGTFVALSNNCKGYIYCNPDGDSYIGNCDGNYYFDTEAQECIFDEFQQCNVSEEEEIFGIPLETEDEDIINNNNIAIIAEELSEIAEEAELSGRPNCRPDKNEYLPYAWRCEYYYKCFNGYLSIFRCNFDYGWDYKTEQCKPIEETECYSHSADKQ